MKIILGVLAAVSTGFAIMAIKNDAEVRRQLVEPFGDSVVIGIINPAVLVEHAAHKVAVLAAKASRNW